MSKNISVTCPNCDQEVECTVKITTLFVQPKSIRASSGLELVGAHTCPTLAPQPRRPKRGEPQAPPVEHALVETSCICGNWSAQLGESITRGFDKHLIEMNKQKEERDG